MNSKPEFHQHPVVRVVPVRGILEELGEAVGGQVQSRGRGGRTGRGVGFTIGYFCRSVSAKLFSG